MEAGTNSSSSFFLRQSNRHSPESRCVRSVNPGVQSLVVNLTKGELREGSVQEAVEVCNEEATSRNQNRQAELRNNGASGHVEGRKLAEHQQNPTIELEYLRLERRALARSPLCIVCAGVSRKAGVGEYLSCRNCLRVFLPSESIQAVVAQGDGIFCGIFPGDEKNPTLALFQSRKTGNALAIALLFLNANSVRDAISESDLKFQNKLRGNTCT